MAIYIYTDDILLFRQIHSTEDAKRPWCHHEMEWRPEDVFNFGKCIHLKITNQKNNNSFHKLYETTSNASIQKCYLFIGVTIDEYLKWSDYIERTVCKANYKISTLGSSHIKKVCYIAMVRPILEYLSVVCSPFTNSNIATCTQSGNGSA